jgi:hypothetical protein
MATAIKLSDEATAALAPLARWLSTNSRFRRFQNYELCDDNEGLLSNSGEFLKHFKPAIEV